MKMDKNRRTGWVPFSSSPRTEWVLRPFQAGF